MSNYNFNYTRHNESPCKGCEKRYLGCHDGCEAYQMFIAQNEKDNKEDQIIKDGFAYSPWKRSSLIGKRRK